MYDIVLFFVVAILTISIDAYYTHVWRMYCLRPCLLCLVRVCLICIKMLFAKLLHLPLRC